MLTSCAGLTTAGMLPSVNDPSVAVPIFAFSASATEWTVMSPSACGACCVEVDGQVNHSLLQQHRQPLKQRHVELDPRLRGVGLASDPASDAHLRRLDHRHLQGRRRHAGDRDRRRQVEEIRSVGHRGGHADHLQHVHLGVRCVARIAGCELQHVAELEVRRRAELCGEGSKDPGRGNARRVALVVERLRGRVEKILELHLGVEDLVRRTEPELREDITERHRPIGQAVVTDGIERERAAEHLPEHAVEDR